MTTDTRKTPRTIWIDARTAELTAKGWKLANATKRAAKEYRLQSPQHIAAQRRNRDLARERAAHLAGN
jgi:hypothetical protein